MSELHVALGEMRTAARLGDQQRDELYADLADLHAQVEALRAEAEEERAGEAEREAQYEAEIRRGDHGPALQEVQRRVDRGETTTGAVMDGTDEHWSAKQVRQQLIGAWRRDIDELIETDQEFARDYEEVTDLPGRRPGEWPSDNDQDPADPRSTPTPDDPKGSSGPDLGGIW